MGAFSSCFFRYVDVFLLTSPANRIFYVDMDTGDILWETFQHKTPLNSKLWCFPGMFVGLHHKLVRYIYHAHP